MKKVSRIFALLLVGAVLGVPPGVYLVQRKFVDKEKALGMVNEEALVDDYAKKEFIYAHPQNAREALTYAIEIHKEMQGTSTLSGWPEKSDLGWCYAALSLIEESAVNPTVAENYMSQAQQILKELGLKDPTESHIRKLVQRMPATNQPSSV